MNYKNITLALICLSGLFSVFACAPKSEETTPEMAQNIIKLRGFNFTEAEFFRAVNLEDTVAVRGFFQAGINPNAKNEKGETALTFAIPNKDSKIVKVLTDRADINLKDGNGNTPLFLAVKNLKEETFDLLLEKGADANSTGRGGGKAENQTALYAALIHGREDFVQKLLEKGADPNIADSEGSLPLSEAVVRRDADPRIVKMLIEKGANVNAQESNKTTALIYASANDKINPQTRLEIVQFLLDKGADKTIKGEDGKTALDWAKKQGNKETAELLQK